VCSISAVREHYLAVSPINVNIEEADQPGGLPDGGGDADAADSGSGYAATSPAQSEAEQGVYELGDEVEVKQAVQDGVLHHEVEESALKLGQSSPVKPTMEEVQEHNISHLPYRSWCSHCVRGRGRTLAHRRIQESDEVKARRRPVVAIDYFYLGARSEETLPLLAMLDESMERLFSIAMPCKGVGHQYCNAIVVKLMRCLGLQNAILRSDGERALVALRQAVQEVLVDVGSEDAVKGESATNGPIENAVGRLQGQARTLKSSLEEHYGGGVHPKHPVLSWLVNYCGCLISRFLKGADGRTAYERSTGKRWRIQLPEFAETVLYQPLKGERDVRKIEPRFEKGIYLGIQEGTAMRWIGTEEGVVRTWTIKRLADDEKWDKALLDKMVGLPWQLRPTSSKALEDERPEIAIELAEPEAPEEEKPVEKKKRGYVPRGIYVRKDVELKQFGFTEGCDGCDRARHGLSHRAHTKACKERIMGEMRKTEAGRKKVEKMERRAEEFIVAAHDRDEKKRSLGEGGKDPKKVAMQEQALEDMDRILGLPVEPAAASSLPAPSPPEEGGGMADVAGEDPMEVEGRAQQEAQGAMDIGALHMVAAEKNFKTAVREASVAETAQLMLDEEINDRRTLLQMGAIGVKEAYDFSRPTVVELFSPPRLTSAVGGRTMANGVALDLRTTDEFGEPWDFNKQECCDRADRLVEMLDPDLVLGCPPCGPFSALQELNKDKMDPEVFEAKLQEGTKHLEFCCQQYEKRMKANKYFVHEHPALAKSWKNEKMQKLEDEPSVRKVHGDMCEMGMQLQDSDGLWGYAKKRTGFLTNSPCIAEELEKKCTNEAGAIEVWRETCYEPKKGQLPGRKGPKWKNVVRRVTLDVTNGRVLQDLQDASNATKDLVKFAIPEGSIRVETLFYHRVPGKSWHRHIPLMGGKAKQCEVYPDGLIRAVLRGLRRQLKKDIPVDSLSFGPTNQEVDLNLELGNDEDWESFTDEVSGKALEAGRVRQARLEEIDFARIWSLG